MPSTTSSVVSRPFASSTVMTSLVIVGEPNDFSMTTLRPLGPSVTFTASASVFTPLRMASRARTSKRISFAMCLFLLSSFAGLLLDDAEDVFLAHHQMLFAFDLDLGSGVLREQNAVTHLHIQRAYLSVLQHLSVADGEHLTLDRLLLRRVGDDDADLRLDFLLHSLDDDAILQRPNLHGFSPCWWGWHSIQESAKARPM